MDVLTLSPDVLDQMKVRTQKISLLKQMAALEEYDMKRVLSKITGVDFTQDWELDLEQGELRRVAPATE